MVFSFLNKKITNLSRQSELSKPSDIKLTIVAFEDDCLDNSGKILAQILEKEPYFNVDYYDETFDKSFLDLQSRNFFDFIDTGKLILKKTKADVLIWGYREQNNLRLNFQTLNQYEDVKKPFFSLWQIPRLTFRIGVQTNSLTMFVGNMAYPRQEMPTLLGFST